MGSSKVEAWEVSSGWLFDTYFYLMVCGRILSKHRWVLAIATFWSFSLFLTWQASLVCMVALYTHELGHLGLVRRFGLQNNGILFFPFFGGGCAIQQKMTVKQDL